LSIHRITAQFAWWRQSSLSLLNFFTTLLSLMLMVLARSSNLTFPSSSKLHHYKFSFEKCDIYLIFF
jgi:hypothetical protein